MPFSITTNYRESPTLFFLSLSFIFSYYLSFRHNWDMPRHAKGRMNDVRGLIRRKYMDGPRKRLPGAVGVGVRECLSEGGLVRV